MSYIRYILFRTLVKISSQHFNEDSYEGLIDTGEDPENRDGPVKIVSGDKFPFVRFQQVRFTALDDLKKNSHIQVTYFLYLAKDPEV